MSAKNQLEQIRMLALSGLNIRICPPISVYTCPPKSVLANQTVIDVKVFRIKADKVNQFNIVIFKHKF
jgi:hypothetical protein